MSENIDELRVSWAPQQTMLFCLLVVYTQKQLKTIMASLLTWKHKFVVSANADLIAFRNVFITLQFIGFWSNTVEGKTELPAVVFCISVGFVRIINVGFISEYAHHFSGLRTADVIRFCWSQQVWKKKRASPKGAGVTESEVSSHMSKDSWTVQNHTVRI